MQPLSYQIGKTTCWPTSIINGIIFLRNGERIEAFQYKILHCALNAILWREGVQYYEYDDIRDFESVTKSIENTFSVKIDYFMKQDVGNKIQDLHFENQVAICDIGNGRHSILLKGRKDGWFSAFYPWWYESGRVDNENVKFPNADESKIVNIRIRRNHLLDDSFERHTDEYIDGRAYPMGKNMSKRFVTVISIP